MNLKNFFSIAFITISLQSSAYSVGNDYALEGEETPEQREARQQEEIEGFVRIYAHLSAEMQAKILLHGEQSADEVAQKENRFYEGKLYIPLNNQDFVDSRGFSFYFPERNQLICFVVQGLTTQIWSQKMDFETYKTWRNDCNNFNVTTNEVAYRFTLLGIPTTWSADTSGCKIFPTSKPGSFLFHIKYFDTEMFKDAEGNNDEALYEGQDNTIAEHIYCIDFNEKKLLFLEEVSEYATKNFGGIEGEDTFTLNLSKDGGFLFIIQEYADEEKENMYKLHQFNLKKYGKESTGLEKKENFVGNFMYCGEREVTKLQPNAPYFSLRNNIVCERPAYGIEGITTVYEEATLRATLNAQKTTIIILDMPGSEENKVVESFRIKSRPYYENLADYFKKKGVCKEVSKNSQAGFDSMEELLAHYETDPFPSQEKNDKPDLKRQKLLQ